MPLDKHSAPGANAGFIYQFERALYWLAKSPSGFVIGIETSDDVVVRSSDGAFILEQDKHSVRKKSTPFGDRSRDLWNTLAIWLDALVSGEVSPSTTRFFMVTNKVLPAKYIASHIGRATEALEISNCIAKLEEAGKNPPKDISTSVNIVLNPDSRSALKVLIGQCELRDASDASAGSELRKRTVSYLQLPKWCSEIKDSIIDELSGWLQKAALDSWRKQEPAWIKRNNLVNQLHAILDARKRQIRRERAENLIPVSPDEVSEKKGRPFVKQLHLITDDGDTVDTAIREFIRCNIEKIRLSREGNITDGDWKSFEVALRSRWAKISTRVNRMSRTDNEEDIGYKVFTETTENHREYLAGIPTEQVYLTAGTYHRLADMIVLGWHPRYKELLTDSGDEK